MFNKAEAPSLCFAASDNEPLKFVRTIIQLLLRDMLHLAFLFILIDLALFIYKMLIFFVNSKTCFYNILVTEQLDFVHGFLIAVFCHFGSSLESSLT